MTARIIRTVSIAAVSVLLFCSLANAEVTVSVLPTTSTIPVHGIQSVTAQVRGTGDARVNWTASSGCTLIGNTSNHTIGVKRTTTGTCTVTATSTADNTKTAQSTVTVTAAPTPKTCHPRIWVTCDNLEAVRAWATSSNPVFQNGLLAAATSAKTQVDAVWSWSFDSGSGTPTGTWADPGDAYSLNYYTTESYMGMLAFYSLLAPDQATKDAYGKRSRDLLMYVMNNAATGGSGPDSLWRDPKVSFWDRARTVGWAWGATVDWLQAGNYLSSADKATIAQVFKMWGKVQNDPTKAVTSAEEFVSPVGVVNDPSLLADGTSLCCSALMWKADNRNISGFTAQMFMALALDEADDPKTNAVDPWDAYYNDGSTNTVRGLLKSATGAWMYQQWALFEDADVVAAAYNINKASYKGLGKAAGGYSVEGTLYDEAMGRYLMALFALHTSGNDDPSIWGPQVSMYNSSYWDLRVHGMLTELTPTTRLNNGFQTYEAFTSRDVYTLYWRDTDHQTQANALALTDNYDGKSTSDRATAAKWMMRYGVFRGSTDSEFYGHAGGNGLVYFNADEYITAFLAFDPARGQTPSDVRANYSTDYVSPSIGRVLSRKDWTANSSAFAFYCPWLQTNHQTGNCGTIDFYRKGEWLAKYRSGYYWDYEQYHPEIQNTLAIRNADVAGYPTGWQTSTLTSGGQWSLGFANASPSVLISAGANYTFAHADSTGLYNHTHPFDSSKSLLDVTHSSRDVIYLKDADRVMIYDRATTAAAGEWKKFYLNLAGTVTSIGNRVTLTSPSAAQKMYITALLPNSGTTSITTPAAWDTPSNQATGEPTTIQYTVTDTANPLDTRFLNVLEATDAATAASTVTLVQSSSGTNFDGSVIGTTAVMFKKSTADTFSTVTYAASGATTHYVANLTPNRAYNVTKDGSTSEVQADSAGVLTFSATGTGNVTVQDGNPPDPPSTTGASIGGGAAIGLGAKAN